MENMGGARFIQFNVLLFLFGFITSSEHFLPQRPYEYILTYLQTICNFRMKLLQQMYNWITVFSKCVVLPKTSSPEFVRYASKK